MLNVFTVKVMIKNVNYVFLQKNEDTFFLNVLLFLGDDAMNH